MDITQASRIAEAMQVHTLVCAGISLANACKKVGITPDIYYRWINVAGDDSIQAIRSVVETSLQRQLLLILEQQEEGLRKMLGEMTDNKTSPGERLAIIAYVNTRLEKLAEKITAQAKTEDAALQYLSGPTLSKGQSRSRTINIATRSDGSVDITTYQNVDIIDAVVSDKPTEEEMPLEQLYLPLQNDRQSP